MYVVTFTYMYSVEERIRYLYKTADKSQKWDFFLMIP